MKDSIMLTDDYLTKTLFSRSYYLDTPLEDIVNIIDAYLAQHSYISNICNIIFEFSVRSNRVDVLEYLLNEHTLRDVDENIIIEALHNCIVYHYDKSGKFLIEQQFPLKVTNDSVMYALSRWNLEDITHIQNHGYCLIDPEQKLFSHVFENYEEVLNIPLLDYIYNLGVSFEDENIVANLLFTTLKSNTYHSVDRLNYLIDKGVDLNIKGGVLLRSLFHKSQEMVFLAEFILNNGGILDDPDQFDDILLNTAKRNDLKTLEFLLNKGITLNPTYDNLILTAAKHGSLEYMIYLMEKGFDSTIARQNANIITKEWFAEQFYNDLQKELPLKQTISKKTKI